MVEKEKQKIPPRNIFLMTDEDGVAWEATPNLRYALSADKKLVLQQMYLGQGQKSAKWFNVRMKDESENN